MQEQGTVPPALCSRLLRGNQKRNTYVKNRGAQGYNDVCRTDTDSEALKNLGFPKETDWGGGGGWAGGLGWKCCETGL